MIRNLPQLQKLDNVVIAPEEIAEAHRKGLDLVNTIFLNDVTVPGFTPGWVLLLIQSYGHPAVHARLPAHVPDPREAPRQRHHVPGVARAPAHGRRQGARCLRVVV